MPLTSKRLLRQQRRDGGGARQLDEMGLFDENGDTSQHVRRVAELHRQALVDHLRRGRHGVLPAGERGRLTSFGQLYCETSEQILNGCHVLQQPPGARPRFRSGREGTARGWLVMPAKARAVLRAVVASE